MPASERTSSSITQEDTADAQGEKRMRLAAKAAQLGIYEWDIPTDQAIWENDRMYEIFGVEPADGPITNAQFLGDFLHPEDVALFHQAMAGSLAQGTPFHFVCRIEQKRSKEQRWVEFNGELEKSPSGEPLRLNGVIQDITERQRLENDRDRFMELGSDLQVITGMNGHYQWVSPAFEDLLGWSPEEFTKRPWTFFVHPDDVASSEKEVANILSGKPTFAFENRYRHRDGYYLWLKWNARTYPNENVIYGVATDATERKHTEQDQLVLMEITEALAHLIDPNEMMDMVGKKLSAHLDVSRCAFVEYDLQGGTAAIVHEESVPGMKSITGTYRMDTMIEPETMEALHRGQQLIINDLRSDPMTADRYPLFEALNIGSSLTSPYVSDGKCKCGITIHHREPHDWETRETRLMKDLSERTWSSIERARIGLRLQHSRDRLRLLTDAIPVLISYLDKDHHYRFVNKTYTEWFKVEREEIIGKHLKEIVGEAVYNASLPMIERVLSGEAFKYEQLHPYKHGGTRFVEVSYVPDVSEDGEVKGWYALVQDISDRKANEEALKDADRRKDEFLATLSHELRNPMAPLRSALEILEMGVDEEEASHARAIMMRQVERMTHLINDLMDISRITRGQIDLHKKKIDLNVAILEAAEATDPLIKAEGHSLTIELPDAPVLIHADEDRMVQVLTNLLSNAAKYTDRGGVIQVQLAVEKDQAIVRVKDNGIGIASSELDRIFEMFNQVAARSGQRHGGLGIGLNLVKNLVEMHGGTITVDSAGLGKGSEFVLTLRVAEME